MSLIQAENLTFYYDGSFGNIFEGASFRIDTDWKLGLVGRNGRGKTTLLKLLQREFEYKGTIKSDVVFDYFPYSISNTQRETMEVMEEMAPDFELWKVCKELTLLDVDAGVLYRSFSTLSYGEQTKVMLAVLFSSDEHFLLIDEPTNHLDREARAIVMEYLKSKKGFILVSHDRHFVDGCVDHIMAINKAQIEVVKGNFSSWWENKEKRDNYEKAENERLKKDIKRLEQASKQAGCWADEVESTKIGHRFSKVEKSIELRSYIGEKSKRMQRRRKNLEARQEKNIDEKKGLLKNLEQTEDLKLFPQLYHKKRLITLEDVSISYGNSRICEHMNMVIEQGDKIALQGKNGCGKSSIIKLIQMEHKMDEKELHYTGKVQIASGLTISYVSQDTSWLKGGLREFAHQHGLEEHLFLAMLRKLDFHREQFYKSMEEQSQGQKKKILLAKSLCEKAHIYIWDEPLNFIDIFSRMQIVELIKQYNPTMLFVEHDQYFSEEIATKKIDFMI